MQVEVLVSALTKIRAGSCTRTSTNHGLNLPNQKGQIVAFPGSLFQTTSEQIGLWRPQKFSPRLCARGTWYWNVAQTARASCRLLQQESLQPSCWSRTVTLRAASPQPGLDMVSSIMPIGTCQDLIIHKGFTCNTRSNLKYLYNNNLLIHLICFVQFGSF